MGNTFCKNDDEEAVSTSTTTLTKHIDNNDDRIFRNLCSNNMHITKYGHESLYEITLEDLCLFNKHMKRNRKTYYDDDLYQKILYTVPRRTNYSFIYPTQTLIMLSDHYVKSETIIKNHLEISTYCNKTQYKLLVDAEIMDMIKLLCENKRCLNCNEVLCVCGSTIYCESCNN